MDVRTELERDRTSVRAVNESAFGRPDEAMLVDTLRAQARPLISLVAEEGGSVIGHIMFSPVSISGRSDVLIMGLAPMAVVPGFQGRGVGTALAGTGLVHCRDAGAGAVVVLGHPDYYPRFGFTPAARFGIDCEYDVPAEAFMALELWPGYLRDVSGTVRFHPAFADV